MFDLIKKFIKKVPKEELDKSMSLIEKEDPEQKLIERRKKLKAFKEKLNNG